MAGFCLPTAPAGEQIRQGKCLPSGELCPIRHDLFDSMKAGLHPDYTETTITCTCGSVYHTRSTRKNIKIGICAACHPFFTGEQKFIDTAGRVEKFSRRYGSVKAARIKKA
jgi:large subunit ribosomal protein L31